MDAKLGVPMPKAVCVASGNDGANSSSRMRFGHELCILADEKLIGRMLDSYPALNPAKEKQTRAAWLTNFKHRHEEFWSQGLGGKTRVCECQEFKRWLQAWGESCSELSSKQNLYSLIFFRRQKGFHLRRWLYIVFVSSSLVVSLQLLLFDLIRTHCRAVSLKHQGMRVAQWVSLHLRISVADSTVSPILIWRGGPTKGNSCCLNSACCEIGWMNASTVTTLQLWCKPAYLIANRNPWLHSTTTMHRKIYAFFNQNN